MGNGAMAKGPAAPVLDFTQHRHRPREPVATQHGEVPVSDFMSYRIRHQAEYWCRQRKDQSGPFDKRITL